jgi:IclR family acetate operon transcriptional repressor
LRPPSRDENTNRSLEKALKVLVALGDAGHECGITDLCKSTGYPLGTMARIITTLGKMKFVIQNPATKKYTLGPAITRLATSSSELMVLRNIARPILYELRNRTGETSHLYVRRGPYREHFDFVESSQELRTGGAVGDRVPIHAGAASRVLWAFDTDEEIAALLDSLMLSPMTKNTVVEKVKLLREVKKIRRFKYAVSYGERNPSIGSVAAPVFDGSGKVIAAISVSMPSVRFDPDHVQQLIPEVLKAATELHRSLQGRSDSELPPAAKHLKLAAGAQPAKSKSSI